MLAPDALEFVAKARDMPDQLVFPDDFAEFRTLPA